MENIQVFNKSIRGASHIASGKPCQDYSVSLNDNGVQILVVCDGHGGETYFRSDRGAELAANITAEILRGFSNTIDSSYFAGCSYSITAKPQKNPFVDSEGYCLRFENMNDNQKRYAKQAQSYTEASSKYVDKQETIRELLKQIYDCWKGAILEDKKNNPFSPEELQKLQGKNIEKAYGCTLLAYMQTESYWLSFQIGDGKVLFCSTKLEWSTPIPEDCNCFLNYTTSLCDSHPIDEFRYSFSGDGVFPFAVFLCSDGIEGSLRTDSNIQDFYEQIIELCSEGVDVNSELKDYLPELSEKGNKDDLSISGAVYMTNSNADDISKNIEVQRKKRAIWNERNAKKNELDKLSSRIETLRIKLTKHLDDRSALKRVLDNLKRSIQEKEKDFKTNEDAISVLQSEIRTLQGELKTKEREFHQWNFTVKNDIASLEDEMNSDNKDEDWKSIFKRN